jgi:hypothetical protein
MNLKPGLTQVFGRFLSLNQVDIFCPNLRKPGFELISAGFQHLEQIWGDKRVFQTESDFCNTL